MSSPAVAFRPPVAALAASLVGVALGAGAPAAVAEPYELDPAHTAVAFLVDHVGYSRTLGRFTEAAGTFELDPDTGALTGLRVTVATASVDTDHEARDEHVRSADFLDVENHPEMVFEAEATVATDGEGEGEGGSLASGTLEGTLTLLGQTRPLALEYTLNKAAEYPFGHGDFTLGVSLRGALSRSDWGMDYGVADGLVGDEVELLIETEANRR